MPISSSVFFVAADEPICERSRLIGTRILAVSAGSTAFAGRLPLALLDMSFSLGGIEVRAREERRALGAEKLGVVTRYRYHPASRLVVCVTDTPTRAMPAQPNPAQARVRQHPIHRA